MALLCSSEGPARGGHRRRRVNERNLRCCVLWAHAPTRRSAHRAVAVHRGPVVTSGAANALLPAAITDNARMTSTRDAWLSSFEEARSTCDDVFLLLAERDDALREGATSAISRLSATARRKWSALKAKLDALAADVASGGVCAPARAALELPRRKGCRRRTRSRCSARAGASASRSVDAT